MSFMYDRQEGADQHNNDNEGNDDDDDDNDADDDGNRRFAKALFRTSILPLSIKLFTQVPKTGIQC